MCARERMRAARRGSSCGCATTARRWRRRLSEGDRPPNGSGIVDGSGGSGGGEDAEAGGDDDDGGDVEGAGAGDDDGDGGAMGAGAGDGGDDGGDDDDDGGGGDTGFGGRKRMRKVLLIKKGTPEYFRKYILGDARFAMVDDGSGHLEHYVSNNEVAELLARAKRTRASVAAAARTGTRPPAGSHLTAKKGPPAECRARVPCRSRPRRTPASETRLMP